MKKIVLAVLLLASYSALANESFLCEYSKAPVNNGVMGTLNILGNARVVFNGNSFKAFRPDGSYIITPVLAEKKEGMIFLDDKTKIFAASLDKSNFAVSDRIMKTTEQWAKCEIDQESMRRKKIDSDVKEQMRRISEIPWDGQPARKFFLKETHFFMLLKCGWAGSVGFSTGTKPLVLLGSSYFPSDKSAFKDGEYSIEFNGGTMSVNYNPKKVSGYISDNHSFTPCEAVRLGED
ncbi:hypothetical protein CHU32_09820 [Superficieibacter electus]|uniref:Conjugal transfer protein n=1 Tax=Superficieibacter electus TaxID=2022662 RepID=A0A2P5GQQ2_9ENTR|nr:hypothetical protein [Superficieibacter electus]POP43368.1 hypothetical protein CHU33_15935 [Superficieibacter electus]POP48885.1 hypothetical protein CHU32_09820 [Superficieibacter electus]